MTDSCVKSLTCLLLGRATRLVVGSKVANSLSSATTAASVSRLSRVLLPAFVYPTNATTGTGACSPNKEGVVRESRSCLWLSIACFTHAGDSLSLSSFACSQIAFQASLDYTQMVQATTCIRTALCSKALQAASCINGGLRGGGCCTYSNTAIYR